MGFFRIDVNPIKEPAMPKDHYHHDAKEEPTSEQKLQLLQAREVLRLGTEMAQELANAKKAHDAKPSLGASFIVFGTIGTWLTFGPKIAGYAMLSIAAVALILYVVNSIRETTAIFRAAKKSEEL